MYGGVATIVDTYMINNESTSMTNTITQSCYQQLFFV